MTANFTPEIIKSRRGKRRSANRRRQRPRQRKPELSSEAKDWLEYLKLLRAARPRLGELPRHRDGTAQHG